MGSGPSKPKNQEKSPPLRSDNVSKSARQLKIESTEKKQTVVEKAGVGDISKHTVNEGNKFQTGSVTTKVNTNNFEKKNGRVNNNEVKKQLGAFESDSESEGEDINAVLEATKNEYNSRLQEQQYTRDNDASYPETYAQRLQREQYRNQPQGILRQKTIYRNPEEWEVDENETESFDVSKFKEANLHTKQANEENSMLNSDIFTPNLPEANQKVMAPDPENYYFQPKEKQKSLPHYDTSEEALLAEIEKEFDL